MSEEEISQIIINVVIYNRQETRKQIKQRETKLYYYIQFNEIKLKAVSTKS